MMSSRISMLGLVTRHSAWGLLLALCLCSSPAVLRTAAAASPVPGTAAVIGQKECGGVDAKLAHAQADEAFRKAQYRQAAQCYLIAGDKPRADLAFIKAAAADNATTKRQMAANANQVKEQMRQLREVFTSH